MGCARWGWESPGFPLIPPPGDCPTISPLVNGNWVPLGTKPCETLPALQDAQGSEAVIRIFLHLFGCGAALGDTSSQAQALPEHIHLWMSL